MKGSHIPYTKEELAWIRARRRRQRRALHAAFVERFGRTDVSFDNLTSLCKRNGWLTGRTGRYEPGRVSENKGKKMPYSENSARTRFQKGHRGGMAEKLYKPIGTERISDGGYLERKINDDMPLQARWRGVHLILWEDMHGPVPDGMVLKCLDGNKANPDPENWEMVPKGVVLRMNRRGLDYDNASAELKPAILTIAKIEHMAGQIGRLGAKTAVADE